MTRAVALGLAPALPFSSPFRLQRETREDVLGFLARWAELGGVVRFESRFFLAYLVTAPEAVQHILQDNSRSYVKELRSAGIFRIALGDGLFLSEGDSGAGRAAGVSSPTAGGNGRLDDRHDRRYAGVLGAVRWARRRIRFERGDVTAGARCDRTDSARRGSPRPGGRSWASDGRRIQVLQ
jgi:hypothetical protein